MKPDFNSIPEEEQKKIRKTAQPDWVNPMLATLTHDHFSDDEWIFERKLDGVRCLVFKDGQDLRIMSRNKKIMNSTYSELVSPLRNQSPASYIVDGEIVTFRDGVTSFSRLQKRINVEKPDKTLIEKVGIYLYLFDIIHIENHDLTRLALEHRKSILKKAFSFDHKIKYTIHRNARGEEFLKEACDKKWEGLIAKKRSSRYVHSRSRSWLKFKCVRRQEFVIGGYTQPEGERKGFGALLVGFYEDNRLKYAGKVGTGYDDDLLITLHRKMKKLKLKKSPFSDETESGNINWISPKLVAEVGFTEWTRKHRLRHPRFIGLRVDKDPEEVVREEPD